MKIIVFTNHSPERARDLAERHAKKTGRPVPPTPPRAYMDLGTGEEARRLVHIPKGDARDVESILASLDTERGPVRTAKGWATMPGRA